MWYCPDKYKRNDIIYTNDYFKQLKGTLTDKEAKISLARFLRTNIGLTTQMISGIELWPYQEIMLRGMLNRNFCLNVWGRGASKSTIASIFCFLQCIFEPKTKIIIAGPTFRTARNIFVNLEKMVDSPGAELLTQCFGLKQKRNDEFDWSINGGSIKAIPLNGEKIRGFRANVLVLDEFLLLSEDIIKNVLMPFLIVPQDISERIKVRGKEKELIRLGAMKESERTIFKSNAKMIALSSASYTFENLYKTYKEWTDKIYSDDVDEASYFISQLSYEALPPEMVSPVILEEAQSGGKSHASFAREYCAQFVDGSDSYFSMKKMEECTVPFDQKPHTLIKGEPGKKYVLSIDPNMSDSPSADYFAMAVMEIDEKTKTDVLVHCYAGLGDIKNHVKYLRYIMESFNIVMIVCDNAGADTFFNIYNGSDFIRNKSEEIKQIEEMDMTLEGMEYTKMLQKCKGIYNLENKKILFTQPFNAGDFIRKGNEHLQSSIDYKKTWFASKCCANEDFFHEEEAKIINEEFAFCGLEEDDTIEQRKSKLTLIETIDSLIPSTKKQCSLVEYSTTSRGTCSFDLPQHLRRSTSASRARKDNYTALMLAKWASKCYYDLNETENKVITNTFKPVMF